MAITMAINGIKLVYFSPVSHTRLICRIMGGKLAERLGMAHPAEYDITKPSGDSFNFGADELAVIGIPVFGGRVPGPAAGRLRAFRGEGTPAILVASYGNRAFEDALLELADLAAGCGFRPFAAAACVAEHTIAPSIASGRPDEADIRSIGAFADSVAGLLSGGVSGLSGPDIPGSRPYREYSPKALPQHVDENCVMCGKCARECPVSAISASAPSVVRRDTCISCMRCVNVCPVHARHPEEAFISAVSERLNACCRERKENSYFWPDGSR